MENDLSPWALNLPTSIMSAMVMESCIRIHTDTSESSLFALCDTVVYQNI